MTIIFSELCIIHRNVGGTLHQFCQLGMFWSIACNIMETSQMITTVNNITTSLQKGFRILLRLEIFW